MTRKDYEIIAHVARECAANEPDPAGSEAIHGFCGRLADELAKDNPRFDAPRFLTACGIKVLA